MSLEQSLLTIFQCTYGPSIKTIPEGITLVCQEAAQLVQSGHYKEHTPSHTGYYTYASEAGQCARKIALRILSTTKEEISDQLKTTFLTGDLLHELVQKALTSEHPDFLAEQPWFDHSISGRADGLYSMSTRKQSKIIDQQSIIRTQGSMINEQDSRVVEIKSCSKKSFAFALWKGPKLEHILQASLSALYYNASKIHIIYIAKEPVTTPKKLKPLHPDQKTLSLYEWIYPLDRSQALQERDRLEAIVQLISNDQSSLENTNDLLSQVTTNDQSPLGQRTIPDTTTAYGYIDDPNLFVYPCSYCAFKEQCLTLGPGEKLMTNDYPLMINDQLSMTND